MSSIEWCPPGSVFREKRSDLLWIKCKAEKCLKKDDWLLCGQFLAANKSRVMSSGELFGFGICNFTRCIL
jgi:hypothetical protein